MLYQKWWTLAMWRCLTFVSVPFFALSRALLLSLAIAIVLVGAATGQEIEFVAAEEYTSDEELTASFALDVPGEVAEGDLLVASMFHGADPEPTITAPAGWIRIYQHRTVEGKHTVYYRFAGEAEPDSYTWTLGDGKHVAAGMATYRGVHPDGPIISQDEAHVYGAEATLELHSTVPNARLILFAAAKGPSDEVALDGGLTERYRVRATSRLTAMADETLESPGDESRSVSVEGAEEIFAFGLVLRPAGGPNEAPILDPLADRRSFEGDAALLQLRASDFEGDGLTFAATGLPPGLSIEPSDGRITGWLDADAAGSYDVTVSVDDGENDAVEESFTWTVHPASGPIALIGTESYTSGDELVTTFSVGVPEGILEDDLIVTSLFHGADPDPEITPPPGWMLLSSERSVNGRHSIYYTFAGDDVPAEYTWSLEAEKNVAAGTAVYRGAHPTTPITAAASAHEENAASASVTLDPPVENARLLLFAAVYADAGMLTFSEPVVDRYRQAAGPRAAHLADEALASDESVTRAAFADDPDGAEVFVVSVALHPAGTAAAAPVLASPKHDAAGLGLPVLLEWAAGSASSRYDVQVGLDEAFTSIVVDTSEVEGPAFLAADLERETTYYWRVRAVEDASPWSPTFRFTTAGAVASEDEVRLEDFHLAQNYPNPFSGPTRIAFTLPGSEHVRLSVFDVLGRTVAVLVDERLAAGTHHVSFKPGVLPAGTYWYRLDGERVRATRTMVLVR